MENEATQSGAENLQTEAPQGSDDAALLSAFLAQQEPSEHANDSIASDPAAQAVESAQPVADVFTVKIDGVEKQVSRDELITHYQKGESSSKRFEEAAQIRREAEAQRANFQQQQNVLQNAIQHFQQQAQRFNIAPPNVALLESNPQEYLRQDAQYRQYQEEMQKAQTAQAYLQQQQAEYQGSMMRQHLEAESAKLLDILPEWKNVETRNKDEQALISYLRDKGYNDQDISGLNTSRAQNIELAIKAMRYDALVKQSKAATKKVEGLPPRVEAPGAANQATKNRDAYNRLSRSGSLDDAAAAFAELFG